MRTAACSVSVGILATLFVSPCMSSAWTENVSRGSSCEDDKLKPCTKYTVATIGGRSLPLYFWPAGLECPTPAPLVIYIHGGGFRHGRGDMQVKALPMLNHCFALASLDYRLTSEAGQWGNEPVIWPAQAHDAKAAIRWLRANAPTLNVDPNAFISFGGSAGGMMSSILALTDGVAFLEGTLGNHTSVSSAVQLCVTWYTPTTALEADKFKEEVGPPLFEPPYTSGLDDPASELLGSMSTNISLTQIIEHQHTAGAPWEELVYLAKTSSPLWYAEGNGGAKPPPPILIQHGDKDTAVPSLHSVRLYDALVARGLDVNFAMIPGGGHGDIDMASWPTDLLVEIANGWVKEHLRAMSIQSFIV